MREEPTIRIPLGILGLLFALMMYGIAVAMIVPDYIGHWHTLVQTIIYLILGLIWLLPLRRFLIWMETGSWSAPEEDE
ncbi:DUF2842 domain-containing protein [Qipengyuania sp. DGS5-3]|uniref:DUF2842 domain-containing protein n=1 Tax=Qipengyuania sp. DGS5-3 TaxID=3349632 RepID=UPI0036D3CB5A